MARLDILNTPQLIFEERLADGSDSTTPLADHRTVFLGEDGLWHFKDSAGVVTTPGGSAGLAAGISYDIDVSGTGLRGFFEVPFAGTITRARLLADVPGNAVVDIWRDTYANHPPTNADSICAAAKPTLSGAIKSEDTTLTGWTTAVGAGDILAVELESVATLTKLTLALAITRS